MNLSHRMDRKHEQAANQAAAARPADLPDTPNIRIAELKMALGMLKDAKESPKFTQHGNVGQCRREDTEERVFAALTRRMTSPQIAKAVGMSEETIRRHMARMHLEGKVRREGPRNSRIWSKA